MVKITNGKNIFEVTRGAFDGIYSRQGYIVVDENANEDKQENVNVSEKSEDEKFVDEIVEKPISQWNKDEVRRFAAINNIDIVGTKNAGEAKELIKKFLNQN